MRSWFRFARAVARREWRVSPFAGFAAVFALVYTVSPIDLVPELFLPVVGYIDDLGLWGVLLALATREKARWEASRAATRTVEG